ncbi:DUF1850 domain-containing protein [Metabacillus malikii]|uniref:RocC n=1 Tax=Metabacillus malikii TaxID=1504265 RepID=A0ABT9ZHJ2_9BACI|nr:DUF1850 domain-containing protein [Metabacillus malikii]MDQ0230675.1 hypothetical protein [Metabacillus malikii]
MQQRLKINIFCFLVLLLVVAVIFSITPYKEVIAFTFEDKQQLLTYLPLDDEETFQITYTHSIHRSDVYETFEVNGNKLKLIEISYEDFAVGMPANAEGEETFEVINGRYYIRNMNQVFPFIDLRIGQVRANHSINYQGNKFQLSNVIEPGTWVRFSVKKLSFWQLMKGVNLIG